MKPLPSLFVVAGMILLLDPLPGLSQNCPSPASGATTAFCKKDMGTTVAQDLLGEDPDASGQNPDISAGDWDVLNTIADGGDLAGKIYEDILSRESGFGGSDTGPGTRRDTGPSRTGPSSKTAEQAPIQVAGLNMRDSISPMSLRPDSIGPDVPIHGQEDPHEPDAARDSGDPVVATGGMDSHGEKPLEPQKDMDRVRWMAQQGIRLARWRPQRPEALSHASNHIWAEDIDTHVDDETAARTQARGTAFFGIPPNPDVSAD